MTLIRHNPAELFPPYRGDVHAAEIVGGSESAALALFHFVAVLVSTERTRRSV